MSIAVRHETLSAPEGHRAYFKTAKSERCRCECGERFVDYVALGGHRIELALRAKRKPKATTDGKPS